MDENSGVKAPMTRLRRRLSTDQQLDDSLTATPTTPGKKRGARKPAKPELDLIAENATIETPKKTTRKTANVVEPVEEKTITPSRRSTRIKSNTSLVSEAVVAVESPRAKRATRRTSQIGSDNETPLTPVRQTRRTRKDSTSSLEKAEAVSKPTTQITETIAEEPEINLRKSISNGNLSIDGSESDIRRSPRLQEKNVKNNSFNNSENKADQNEHPSSPKDEFSNKPNTESDKSVNQEKNTSLKKVNSDSFVHLNSSQNIPKSPNIVVDTVDTQDKNELAQLDSNQCKSSPKKNKTLSDSVLLIDNVNSFKTTKKGIINKSTSDINTNVKTTKKRTKSLSSDCNKIMNENQFYSDNEHTKRKNKTEIKSPIHLIENTKELVNVTNETQNSVSNESTKKKRGSEQFFNKDPLENSKPEIFIEDSDSNSEKVNNYEDQCVPVVTGLENKSPLEHNKNSSINKSKDKTLNDSVEPMDVDETLPGSLIIADISVSDTKKAETPNVSNIFQVSIQNNVGVKSKRKSSLTNLEKSENKSTLIISEVKDDSTSELTELRKSPKLTTNNKTLSNSALDLNNTQNIESNKKISSLTCMTSTPLQQKTLQKLTIPLNTSIITQNIDTKKGVNKNLSNKENSKLSTKTDSSEEESSDDESNHKSELINDQASDAGDDYESGDSQDEDERLYEKQNEIVDKGQTLTSEDELSNDSDYEKDSFVVSSDEEDNQLLDGSDDDLSMSDNELSMTAKSKEKYNKRMVKEQKKASREMFEARHKSKKKAQIESTDSSDSDVEVKTKPKQRNRMRFDSSHEVSLPAGDISKSSESKTEVLSTSKTNNSLTKSLCNKSALNEKEITVYSEELHDNDPLAHVKEEPKTPVENKNTSIDFVDASNTNQTQLNQDNSADPLDASMDEDSSSDDDTNNIIQNYDSVLNDLNKKPKNKLSDLSLNLQTRPKNKTPRASIVDQLNLTHTKIGKKSKSVKEKVEAKQSDSAGKIDRQDDDSSDSIDLHLLFSEDSNQTVDNKENNVLQNKQNVSKAEIKKSESDEADGTLNFFIDTKGDLSDLNKSENETKSTDKVQRIDSDSDEPVEIPIQNESIHALTEEAGGNSTKKKKKLLSQTHDLEETVSSNEIEETAKSFVKTPKSERKKKLMTACEDTITESDGPNCNVNLSLVKTPKSEKKKKLSQSQVISESDEPNRNANVSLVKTPKSEKKKKLSESQVVAESDEPNHNVNVSSFKTPESDRKKKKMSESEVLITDLLTNAEEVVNKSLTKAPGSGKKKKNISTPSAVVTDEQEPDVPNCNNVSLLKTPRSEKKKTKISESETITTELDETNHNVSRVKTPKSEKKKKRISESAESEEHNQKTNVSSVKTPSDKNNKKTSECEDSIADSNTEIVKQKDGETLAKTPKSDRKKKRNSGTNNANKSDLLDVNPEALQGLLIENIDEEVNISSSKKKKKMNLSKSEALDDNTNPLSNAEEVVNKSLTKTPGSGKKKKNISTPSAVFTNEHGDSEYVNANNKKRKRKTSQNPDEEQTDYDIILHQTSKQESTLQKNQNKKRKILDSNLTVEKSTNKHQKNKKRKRNDNEDESIPKIIKTNSFDTVPVSRLPASLLNKLEDNPKMEFKVVKKRPKLISTSNFTVENIRRRNKPSNYLEESVYLNDDSPEKKKSKMQIHKPRVLPTIPTASTSSSGYTTNFKINVLPTETKFVAQANNTVNFKHDHLYNKNIKRLGTYELYKKQRNVKLSKF